MFASLRLAAFACVLATLALTIGCKPKIEVKTDDPNPPPVNPQPVNPQPGEPKEDEKDAGLECKAPPGERWNDVKPGDAVRVIGTCQGVKNELVEIVGAGRSYGERPAQAAVDLAAAYKADAKAADAKYKDRQFTVEGVCVSIKGNAIKLSGSKRATAPVGANPLLNEAMNAKAEARFGAADILAGKADLAPYTGKVIEITGRIHTLSLGTTRGAVVGFGHTDAQGVIQSGLIQCLVIEQEPWRRLSYGQTVTIRGKLDNPGLFSNLSQCVIVKESPGPAVKVTAEALAKEYKADKKATDEKYRVSPKSIQGQSLIITGEVSGWGKDASGKSIQLKGADGVKIACYPAPGAMAFPEFEAPPGTKVELVAQYAFFGTNDTVWTNMGLIRVLK